MTVVIPNESNTYAERYVIGACISDREALRDVLLIIGPEDCEQHRHELILAAACRLEERGDPIDAVSVGDELGGDLKRAGGMAYLLELSSQAVVRASAEWYAEKVRDAALLRRVRTIGQRLELLGADDGAEDPLAVVDAARAELDAAALGRVVTHATAEDVYEAIEALESEAGRPVHTPWMELNRAIGGWRKGCLYYIGARPGTGKTALGLNIAKVVSAGRGIAHFASLEMTKVELYHRLIADFSQVSLDLLQDHRLGPEHRDEWERIRDAAGMISRLTLSVDDHGAQTVSTIKAKCRSLARTGELGIVVVDYVQLLTAGRGKQESRQQEVSVISRQLKLMAKDLDVPVVALAQLNRGPENGRARRPTMTDLRESGSLEQDGDAVILLHADPDRPTELDLIIEKNRHGAGRRNLTLTWEGRYARAVDRHQRWT